jgi:hypothetical protein
LIQGSSLRKAFHAALRFAVIQDGASPSGPLALGSVRFLYRWGRALRGQ